MESNLLKIGLFFQLIIYLSNKRGKSTTCDEQFSFLMNCHCLELFVMLNSHIWLLNCNQILGTKFIVEDGLSIFYTRDNKPFIMTFPFYFNIYIFI